MLNYIIIYLDELFGNKEKITLNLILGQTFQAGLIVFNSYQQIHRIIW